jgi:DNA-binding NtrC family response regulator
MQEALTIVVVDDEQPILNIFKSYLEMTGRHTVLTTDKGTEALEMIAGQKVDCCFLDLNMPDMDGIELSRRIHQQDNTIPMAVMTGYPTMDNAISTLKNGVVDFLTKPRGPGADQSDHQKDDAGKNLAGQQHPSQGRGQKECPAAGDQ